LPYQLLTVDALSSHLPYAIRLLLKSPVFTITTILIGSLLYGVSASDPVALGTSVLVLSFAAFLACLLPALRATQIDPITALKE
jgi:ABC-type antimicrobial peptide transport system permease subunit